jgi:uncharacterized protein YndB with AHSA1/START domain
MEKMHFSIQINAPAGKIWAVLWNDDTYRKWTAVFTEGSHAISDWKEGSSVQFLSPEGSGMYSVIEKMEPAAFMSFRHLGEIKQGIEQPPNDESSNWYGAKEEYTLTENNGNTVLDVHIDMTENDKKYFKDKFPAALQQVKKLSEN